MREIVMGLVPVVLVWAWRIGHDAGRRYQRREYLNRRYLWIGNPDPLETSFHDAYQQRLRAGHDQVMRELDLFGVHAAARRRGKNDDMVDALAMATDQLWRKK